LRDRRNTLEITATEPKIVLTLSMDEAMALSLSIDSEDPTSALIEANLDAALEALGAFDAGPEPDPEPDPYQWPTVTVGDFNAYESRSRSLNGVDFGQADCA
jgi:hypothetical protein